MKKAIAAIITIIIALTALATPAQARERKTKTVKQGGNTYTVYQGCKEAALHRANVKRGTVTVPDSITVGSRRYRVTCIHDGALPKGTRRVELKARHLDACEDGRLWSKRVMVKAYDRARRQWLKRTGANVC